MRTLGWTLLVGGALAVLALSANGSMVTYGMWMSHTQHLPPGEMIARNAASAAMAEYQLFALRYVYAVGLSGLITFVGGLILGLTRQRPAGIAGAEPTSV